MEGLLSSDRAKSGCFARIFHAEDKAVPTVNHLPLISCRLESRTVEPGVKVSSPKGSVGWPIPDGVVRTA